MMLSLYAGPTTEPVALDDFKAHLRYTGTTEDALLMSYLVSARETVELEAHRALMAQTFDLKLDQWPGRTIKLPRPPLASITSITYTDSDGVAGTVASSNYTVYPGDPGRIVLTAAGSWPAVVLRPGPSLVVRFVAGYGSAAAVPLRYKQAIKLLAAHWFQNREAVVSGTVPHELELAYRSLIYVDRG